jgi:anti-anti-sigma factor
MTRLCPVAEDDGSRPGRVAIEVDVRPEATTILVRGELDLVTIPALAAPLAQVALSKPRRLVFDLAETRFLDCRSARLIAGSGQWLRDGGRPVIRRAGPGARRVLGLTGLDACCEIEELTVGKSLVRISEQSGAGR